MEISEIPWHLVFGKLLNEILKNVIDATPPLGNSNWNLMVVYWKGQVRVKVKIRSGTRPWQISCNIYLVWLVKLPEILQGPHDGA